jgi:hypothetical protein
MYAFYMHQHPKLNPCSSLSMKVIKLNMDFGVYRLIEYSK